MPTSFDEFFAAYERELSERPGLRLGQAAFNTLSVVHPKLAKRVQGSDWDPFYDDNRLPRFFQHITREWSDV